MEKQTEEEKKEKRREYARTHKEQIALKQKLWRLKNPERSAVHQKKSYNLHIEQRKESNKKYYEDNKNRIIVRQKKYYENNKEDIKEYQRSLRREDPINALFKHAKGRAKKRNIPFSITKEDIFIPTLCPLLGIALFIGDGRVCDNSPTLDRIDSTKGYIKGNIQTISYKANRMKSNSTFEEFQTIYKNWKRRENK